MAIAFTAGEQEAPWIVLRLNFSRGVPKFKIEFELDSTKSSGFTRGLGPSKKQAQYPV
jgi:hypothetical protein